MFRPTSVQTGLSRREIGPTGEAVAGRLLEQLELPTLTCHLRRTAHEVAEQSTTAVRRRNRGAER